MSRAAGRQPQTVVRHLPRVGETTAKLPDGRILRLWSRGDDGISNQVFWGAGTPSSQRRPGRSASSPSRSTVTLDVGAYIGYHTLLAAHANPRGQVLAFEPLPAVADRLRCNVALNNLGNVVVMQCAASDRGGVADFFHARDSELPSSSSLSEAFMATYPELTSSRVEVLRIDDVLEERRVIGVDLVKLDTETTESDVLRGMTATLDRDRPDIICELLEGADGAHLVEVLEPFGYAYAAITPDGMIPQPGRLTEPTRRTICSRLGTRRDGASSGEPSA